MKLIAVLMCAKCGRKSANINRDPHVWDGWRIILPAKCPECLNKENTEKKR